MDEPIKRYDVIMEITIFKYPYCLEDFHNFVSLFNEMHQKEIKCKVKEIKETDA